MDHTPKNVHWQEQYAIATCIYRPFPLEHALRRIAASGFRWVEISQIHMDPRKDPDVKGTAALLRELNLGVHSLHTPFIGVYMGHPAAERVAEAHRVIDRAVEVGAELGAPLAIVHVTTDVAELTDEMYDASRSTAIEFVGELAAKAKALGMRVALENLGTGRQQVRRFGVSLAELTEAFPSPEIGFCLDTGHATLTGLDMRAEIAAAGKRLISTHIASNDGLTDKHWLPNNGLVDWASTKRLLDDGGYTEHYVFEVLGYDDPDAVLREAVETASQTA